MPPSIPVGTSPTFRHLDRFWPNCMTTAVAESGNVPISDRTSTKSVDAVSPLSSQIDSMQTRHLASATPPSASVTRSDARMARRHMEHLRSLFLSLAIHAGPEAGSRAGLVGG